MKVAEATFGRLADDRLHHRFGGNEPRTHEIGDPGIPLEPAEVPVQPVEILLGGQCREQGLGTWIVIGIIERLHRDLQQDLVALRRAPVGLPAPPAPPPPAPPPAPSSLAHPAPPLLP